MWPGFESTSMVLSSGMFLNIDTATKFVNSKSFLDMINEDMDRSRISKQDLAHKYDSSFPENGRTTVITKYGKARSY